MMQANRTPVPMAVSSPSGGLHRHEHDGCATTIVETNHSFEDSRAVGQGAEREAEVNRIVIVCYSVGDSIIRRNPVPLPIYSQATLVSGSIVTLATMRRFQFTGASHEHLCGQPIVR